MNPGHDLLRIFAHGSLVFRPGPLPGAGRPAVVDGWSRRLFHPSVRNWGRPGWPAPTACLVPGGDVVGRLFEIPDPAGEVLAALVHREASHPIEVTAATAAGTLRAFTWTMSDRWSGRTPTDLVDAAVENVRRGGGPSGDARAYADGIARVLGPDGDPLLTAYRAALDAALGRDGEHGGG